MQHPRNLDHRDSYERDRTRVIHCSAFRRMQRKTQILSPQTGDFHRTRLTHSLEVASIGVSIARNLAANPSAAVLRALLPSDDLINTICLLHDIGHPPFGHGGETALNYMMRDYGGFEGNGQTLRLVTKVDSSYGEFGLDLTRRTLLGILKYPVAYSVLRAPHVPEDSHLADWLPPKGYFDTEQLEVEWLLSPFSNADRQLFQMLARTPEHLTHGKAAFHGFDCSIMDIADDIAYGVHDLEDAIHLHLIQREAIDTPVFRALVRESALTSTADQLLDSLFASTERVRKQAIGELVNYFITSVQVTQVDARFENQLFAYNIILSPVARQLLDHCIQLIYDQVIDSASARACEHEGQQVIMRLFTAMRHEPIRWLPPEAYQLYAQATEDASAMRVICDTIACMTDESARRLDNALE
jgi:dGTPase